MTLLAAMARMQSPLVPQDAPTPCDGSAKDRARTLAMPLPRTDHRTLIQTLAGALFVALCLPLLTIPELGLPHLWQKMPGGRNLGAQSLAAAEPRLLAPLDARQLPGTPSSTERWPLRPLDFRALECAELQQLYESSSPSSLATPLTSPSSSPPRASLDRTRTVVERYSDGSIRTSRQVLNKDDGNAENHGLWQWFDPQGQPLARGHFWHGQRQGHWQRWLTPEDAPLLKQLPYRDFTAPFLSQVEFRDDLMHGTWEVIDAQGRIVSCIELVDGDRQGKATWWYPSGSKMLEMNYLQGSLDGEHITWNAQGSIVTQKNYQLGRELRVQTRKFPSGEKQIDEGIALPKLVPNVRDHWWNLTLAAYRTEGHTAKHGFTRQWHANGKLLMEGEFDLDEPVGIHTWWHENGGKLSVGEYRMGRRERLWTWWHPNGQVSQQGHYDVGVAVGLWTAWSPDGTIVRQDEADAFMRSGGAVDQIVVSPQRQALRPVKPTQPLAAPRLLPE